MENDEDDKVTSYFTYDQLFHICKKLNKESSQLKHIVSVSKNNISYLEIENKNLLEQYTVLKRNRVFS